MRKRLFIFLFSVCACISYAQPAGEVPRLIIDKTEFDDPSGFRIQDEIPEDSSAAYPKASGFIIKEGPFKELKQRTEGNTIQENPEDHIDALVQSAIEKARNARKDSIDKYIREHSVPIKVEPEPELLVKPELDPTDVLKKPGAWQADISIDSLQRQKAWFHFDRARYALQELDYKECWKELNQCQKADKYFKESYNMEAELWSGLGYPDKAVVAYAQYLALDSTSARVYYNMSQCFVRLDMKEKALNSLNMAIVTEPSYFPAYYARAKLMELNNRMELALVDYDNCLQINKYYLPALLNRAICKNELNMVAGALEDIERYLDFESRDPIGIYYRGLIKIKLTKFYEGCTDLHTAQSLGYKQAAKEIKLFCK